MHRKRERGVQLQKTFLKQYTFYITDFRRFISSRNKSCMNLADELFSSNQIIYAITAYEIVFFVYLILRTHVTDGCFLEES